MNTFAVRSRQQAPFHDLSVGVSQQLFEIIGDLTQLPLVLKRMNPSRFFAALVIRAVSAKARLKLLSSVFSYHANIFSSFSSGECLRSHMDHLVFLREFSGKLDNLLLSVYSSVQCSLMIGMPEHLLFLAACFLMDL